MSSWTATTQHPISRPSELKDLETLQDGRTLGKKGKAQFEAAKKAAGGLVYTLLSTLDEHEPVHVAMSGAVDENGVTSVSVTVAKAE